MRYRIEYEDPDSGEMRETFVEFEDTEGITAREWAEDYAYGIADKGPHKVTEAP